VPKLIACALVAKHPTAFGFDPSEFEYEQPLEFDEVALTASGRQRGADAGCRV